MIPPVPQTGAKRLAIPTEDEKKLLRRRNNADRSDLFASDPNADVRTLGRLILRRDGAFIGDYLELADLCALLSLDESSETPRLKVFYMGKTVVAFRKAAQLDTSSAESTDALYNYCRWVIEVALAIPSRLNISSALWLIAFAEEFAFASNKEIQVLSSKFVSQNDNKALDILAEDQTDDVQLIQDTMAAYDESDDHIDNFNYDRETRGAVDDDLIFSYGSMDSLPLSSATKSGEALPLESAAPENIDTVGSKQHRSDAPEPDPVGPTVDYLPGQSIGHRYEVKQRLYGGMGLVYLAYDRQEKLPVALKTFQSKFLRNERAKARFTHEALTWVRVEKHPHIVQALLVKNYDHRPFIILEHIAGPEGLGSDLRSWIEHNQIDLELALTFGLHISLGMQHATQKVPGLVHRDLKPGNVLVSQDQIAKVTDFGLVRSIDIDGLLDAENDEDGPIRLTRQGALVGTAPYMSPEQCRAENVDLRSDIYSFGCVMFEMLTRQPLFKASTFNDWIHAHKFNIPHFPEKVPFDIPKSVQNFVLKTIEKNADQRPVTWGEVVDELASIFEQELGHAPTLYKSGQTLELNDILDKAYSLTELGYTDEALFAYRQALELEPRDARTWARQAQALRIVGRADEALTSVNRALEINPRFGWGWMVKGRILEEKGHLERALAAHEVSAEMKAKDAKVWFNQSLVLYSLGRWAEAIEKIDKALDLDPKHHPSWAKKGQILRNMGNYMQALNAFNRALELDHTYYWAWNGKGLCLKALGRLEEAVEAFQHAAEFNSLDVWPWYNLTETLFELQRFHDALNAAKKATRLDQDHYNSWAKMAQIYRYLYRYEDALKAYERAIKLNPTYAWAINGRGIVLERLQRYESAFEAYRRAAELTPDDVWPWYNQGNLLAIQNRLEEAIPLLERAVKVNPLHTRSWARLGNIHRRLSKPKQALVYLDRSLKIDTNYAWAWHEKALTLETLDQLSTALDAHKRASSIDRNNPHFWNDQADLLVRIW